jgi:hypothetical protein
MRRQRAWRWLALVWMAVTAWSVAATEQIPDRLDLDGQTRRLLAEPLAPALDVPATWARFVAHAGGALGGCTANWRGYRASWRLDGDRLLLERIELGACSDAPAVLPVAALFPGRQAPLLADWFDGPLLVQLDDAPPPPDATQATYLLLQLQRGVVVAREALSAAQLQARRAAARPPSRHP